MIGTKIGNYSIVSEIGAGAMGTVYGAEHQLMGRRAAIKILRQGMADNADAVARFLNEARAVNGIRHPNIVEITDVGEYEGRHYLIMEWLHGETLGALLERDGRLPEQVACHIAAQIASALAAAHAQGFIHRDLKPENIFISHQPDYPYYVKVLDFGIAKLVGGNALTHQTRTGIIMGTPYYMSPEQFVGDKTLDHRGDIYSLGVVLYEMLVGAPPFDGDTFGKLLLAHAHQAAEMPKELHGEISPRVEQIVLRALEKDPDQRFQCMRSMRDDLCAGGLDQSRQEVLQHASGAFDEASLMQEAGAMSPGMVPPLAAAPQAATGKSAPAEDFPLPVACVAVVTPRDNSTLELPARAPHSPRYVPAVPSADTEEPPITVDAAASERVAHKLTGIIADRIANNRLVLPAMPQVALKCITLLETDQHSFAVLGQTLEQDPLIATQIMKRANSAGYGGTGSVKTLGQAVGRLGDRELRVHLIELTARQAFRSRSPRIRKAFHGIWEHSLAVAILARKLAEDTQQKTNLELTYLVGLLHDIGKPIVGGLLLEAERALNQRELAFLDFIAWMKVVDGSHREVGGAVAAAWKLPAEVRQAVADCGSYDARQVHCLTNHVCFANALAKLEGFRTGLFNRAKVERIVAEGTQLLGLSEASVSQLSRYLRRQMLQLHGVSPDAVECEPDEAAVG